MPRLIDDRRLEHEFLVTSWTRGGRYFNQGRVGLVEIVDHGTAVQAWVRGTRRQPYRVWLTIEREDDDLFLDGTCTCPAAPPCKHIAATLLAARSDPDIDITPEGDEGAPDDVLPIRRWLQALDERERASAPNPAHEPKPKRRALVYEVFPVEDLFARSAGIAVASRTAILGKNGRFGKPMPYDFEQARVQPRTSVEITDADRLLWFRLTRTSLGGPVDDRERSWLPMTAEATGLFADIVDTGRSFYRALDGLPLRLGPSRTGEVRWVMHEDGTQKLRIFASVTQDAPPTEVRHVLPLVPPHYVDADGTTGPLELPISATTAAAVESVPTLDPAGALALPDELREGLVSRGLPPPERPSVQSIAASEGRPCLFISAGEDRDAEDPFSDTLARVTMGYGGVLVTPGVGEEVELHVEDGEVFEVHRDLGAEVRCLRRLADLHFEVYDDRYGKLAHLSPPQAWLEFLGAPSEQLRTEGWEINLDPALPLAQADAWYADIEEGDGWFDLELGVEIDGERVDLRPLVVAAIRSGRIDEERLHLDGAVVAFELPDGRRLAVPVERLAKILDVLVELFDDRPGDGPLRLPNADAARLLALPDVQWRGGKRLRKLADQLTRAKALPVVKPPRSLRGELRDYQARGLDWLSFLRSHGFGGILADDMGLGKTIQTLTHLLVEKRARRLDRPCLVVAPRSVIGNWARECARFAPTLTCAVYHGPERAQILQGVLPNVIVTTYALLRTDDALKSQTWHVVVLDEAQAIKNPRSRIATVAREIDARQRLCLTGTPMENNLEELWSLMTFACPGLLGTREDFTAKYRRPIEREGDTARLAALSGRIAPFMLRRTKGQVLSELPPKTEVLVEIPLEKKQRDLYESVRMTMEKRVRSALQERGLAKSQIVVLDALLKLRQVCCDPSLVPTETARRANAGSAKLDRLMTLLEELHAEGHRALVFSQFTSMLDIVSSRLSERKIEHRRITGKTRKRQPIVDAFQAWEFPVLLVSLKAGGTGINLTSADVVIHYDPWWNPAVEAQATDRAHRIGQTRPVTVYRLVCEGSVEQRMLALQDRKRALTETLQRDAERRGQGGLSLEADDVARLLAPLS